MLKRVLLFLLFCLALPTQLVRAEEPLEPEKAFRFSAQMVDAETVEASWQIAPGYYMYRAKFAFSATGATLGETVFPKGKVKQDETFGEVETYRDEVRIRVPLSAASGSVTFKATSQGCADLGICYPPMTQSAQLDMPTASSLPTATPAADENEQGQIVRMLRQGSLWLNLITFFGFGLLLSFTPCMLPMVPILSGIIVGHGHNISHARAFVLSSVYGLGMAVTYAVAGVAAGLSGSLLSAALQNPWVLGVFALVFVVLALAMFGFYELQLPSSIQSRISVSANQQGGSLHGIALMGALSAVIVGPCVAAPLAGALLYIAQTRDAVLGGLALFAMALGMGLPLVAVGTFSRSLLPHTGPWMEAVKKFFGVLLLATALWLVKPVIPAWGFMLGCALLLIIPAMYLRAIDPLPPHAKGAQRWWKGVGIVLLLWGGAIVVGLFGGARDPLQPLSFIHAGGHAALAPKFIKVSSVAELDAQLQQAKLAKQPVMLDFYADWCVSCIEMEHNTFSDPEVFTQMQGMRLLRADVTANNADDALLLKRFSLFGPPGIIFYDKEGVERDALRVVGYQPPAVFLPTLRKVSP